MKKKILYILCVAFLIFSCSKKVGCPNDQYNNFNKKKTTTKKMNSNKTPKNKGSISNSMTPK